MDYIMFIQSLRNMQGWYYCREILGSDYINIIRRHYGLKDSDRFTYFGHYKPYSSVVDKYLTVCKLIWGDRLEYDLINLDNVRNVGVKRGLYNVGKDPNNITLIRVKGMVNPWDMSLILFMAWKSSYNQSMQTEMYFIAKKYTNLIPDKLSDMKYGRGYFNGPASYISNLSTFDKITYEIIHKLYLEHKDEVNI
jgi:hypothetical protein